MQQIDNSAALARETEHAKLLTFGHRQVVAYLFRDEDDALKVILQLWIAEYDEQLRVSVAVGDDALTQHVLDSLTNETLPQLFAELRVEELIAELIADHGGEA